MGGNLTKVTIENTPSRGLHEIFDKAGFPLLNRAEIVSNSKIITGFRLIPVKNDELTLLSYAGNDRLNIIITGMPRWGKTTATKAVAIETASFEIPLTFSEEEYLPFEPIDFEDRINFNLSAANIGLAKIQNAYYDQNPHINVYERGFIDHVVYTQALISDSKDVHYKNLIKAFNTYFGHYLYMVNGIIICNSEAETATKRGSNTSEEILHGLASGYKELPHTLSRIKNTGTTPHVPVINLNFESLENPNDTLKRSIYTMIKWNLDGKIDTTK